MHFGRVLSRVDGMIHSTELVRAARRSIVGNVERARFHGSISMSPGNHCRFISFPFLPSNPNFFRIWEKFITTVDETGRSFKNPSLWKRRNNIFQKLETEIWDLSWIKRTFEKFPIGRNWWIWKETNGRNGRAKRIVTKLLRC